MQFPPYLRFIFGKNVLWHKPTAPKAIYLTFDDGPVPEVTPQLLDLLDAENVRATFFCIGENVEKYPELFLEIKRRGHQVGNHTFNHLKAFRTATKNYVQNIQKARTLIQSSLFRPPHGQITWQKIHALRNDFQIVMWDVITCDYDKTLSPKKVLQNAIKYSRNGSIVVFHDSIKAQKNMFSALPAAIKFWKSEGYGFAVL
ncbi:polysaccharide deacetylase [Bacteroidia bacterium]|nr:polysaccharide deacetylase [Bacteroidia bacterium]GHV43979.1 polysaccharide deacetylase [Bacteroidia bacterium]